MRAKYVIEILDHLVKDKKAIEAVQKFALKVITSRWDGGYEELMQLVDLQPLEERRVEMKLVCDYSEPLLLSRWLTELPQLSEW